MFFSCWHCQEIAMPSWKEKTWTWFLHCLLCSTAFLKMRHTGETLSICIFFKSIMIFFTQSDCCITYIYLVDACSCTCVCTWERVWYFCYPCPKSDSSSGYRSWTSNTQIVTTTNSTIYLSIFAMLIALEKMQRLDCTSVSGSNPSVQHSTQRNHWIPLHVQVTIWWFFLY